MVRSLPGYHMDRFSIWERSQYHPLALGELPGERSIYNNVSGYCKLVLEWFVNVTLRSTGEVAGDATQVQSTNEKNQTDRIRHHSDAGGFGVAKGLRGLGGVNPFRTVSQTG